MDNKSAIIFNIVHGSFVDGYGIRTTIFLKGCPLRCLWCCNPEGQAGYPEIKFVTENCNGCNKCLEVCPVNAISEAEDNTIKIEQQKTKDPVLVPLSQTALNILRTGNIFHLPENNIFDLPTDRTTINRALTRWFKAAKVEKKAFYHLSRHTFPVLHLDRGTDIYTVSKLLGHKSLKTTEIYADISSKKLKKSVDNLPILEVK